MRPLLGVLVLLALAAIIGLLVWRVQTPRAQPPRPLFYDVQGRNDMSTLMWRPNRVMLDRRGNYAFVDQTTNLFVLVIAPNLKRADVRYPVSDATGATLLPGTPAAVHVDATKNALLVLMPSGDQHRFQLEAGVAAHWYKTLALVDQDPHANLILSISDLYEGGDKETLLELLQQKP